MKFNDKLMMGFQKKINHFSMLPKNYQFMCTVCDLMKASSHEWRGCYKEIEVGGYCQYSSVKLSILLVREILRLSGKIKKFL